MTATSWSSRTTPGCAIASHAILTGEGFRVTAAPDAAEARARMRGISPDLLVLDVMMPGESGLDLTRSLREEQGHDLPVLMLTARGAPEDRIAGFEAGADDYLPKPFEPRELVLRIRALAAPRAGARARRRRRRPGRSASAPRPSTSSAANCSARNGPIRLTGGEAALLTALATRPGEILSREEIAAALGTDDAGERAVDVQVTRLRRKIEADPREPRFLHTVRGRGYVLKPGV